MDTNTRPLYMLLTRDPPQNKGHIQTESEGLEKDIPRNRDQKKAGVAILISDKIDFKTKAVKRDKEGHYIMIKESIQEEDITIINIGASLVVQRLKPLPAMWETWVQSLGWEEPLEKEMATHSSILAWRIPWTEELDGLQSTGGKESDMTEQLN